MRVRRYVPIVVLLVHCASARGVVLFLDIGDLSSGVQGGPVDNSDPQLFLLAGKSFSLHVWGIPASDDNRIVAGLGHDILIAGSAESDITASAYTLDNPIISNEPRWLGINLVGGLNGAGYLVSDQRAVFVPTSLPFVGGIGSGFLDQDPARDPATGAIYLGQLDLQISSNAQAGASADLRFAVGASLIAGVTTGTPDDEPVFFGFDGNGPEASSGSGSVAGATSADPDAVITITTFADANGDGEINLEDVGAFFDCSTGPGEQTPDINCELFDSDGDGDIDFVDYGAVQLLVSPE